MSVSDPWDGTQPSSQARLNRMTIPTLSGNDIGSLTISQFKVVACNEDGSGFLEDHIYSAKEDGSGWDDISVMQHHEHTANDDGGAFIHLFNQNPQIIDSLIIDPGEILKTNWLQTVTGTGSIEDGTDADSVRYIRLRPNGTSGSGATITYTLPLNVYFGVNVGFSSTHQIETASSLALHCGIGADDITAADSNTRKIQPEVCTTTNNNYWLRTANGSANSASDVGTAIATGRQSIRIKHLFDVPETQLEIDNNGTVLQKSTNIPVDGSTGNGNIVKFSIKNSTGADRPWRIYGARVSYQTSSSWGYGP